MSFELTVLIICSVFFRTCRLERFQRFVLERFKTKRWKRSKYWETNTSIEDVSGSVKVNKLGESKFSSEYETHWGPHLYGLIAHIKQKA